MNDSQTTLDKSIAVGGHAYIRNLAAAELAIQRGQFNVAKVLRAAAHTQRTIAMQAARQLASDLSVEALLETIAAEVKQGQETNSINEAAGNSLADIVERSLASLANNPDILEKDVSIIIMGCYNCGVLTEAEQLEVCPHCGALAVELEWFGPFYANTAEHLGQLTPEEIVTGLEQIPDQVESAIEGIDEPLLSEKPGPDEWSVKEIIAHMFVTDQLFADRITVILAADGVPTLPRTMPPWKLHEGQGFENYSPEQLLAKMREVRAESLKLVRSLRPQDWVRQGTVMGLANSVVDLGTWLVNHDKGHLAQIKRMCDKG